jgi:hypothetical protein
MNVTKEVKDLYNGRHKHRRKGLKALEDGKTSHVHGAGMN